MSNSVARNVGLNKLWCCKQINLLSIFLKHSTFFKTNKKLLKLLKIRLKLLKCFICKLETISFEPYAKKKIIYYFHAASVRCVSLKQFQEIDSPAFSLPSWHPVSYLFFDNIFSSKTFHYSLVAILFQDVTEISSYKWPRQSTVSFNDMYSLPPFPLELFSYKSAF